MGGEVDVGERGFFAQAVGHGGGDGERPGGGAAGGGVGVLVGGEVSCVEEVVWETSGGDGLLESGGGCWGCVSNVVCPRVDRVSIRALCLNSKIICTPHNPKAPALSPERSPTIQHIPILNPILLSPSIHHHKILYLLIPSLILKHSLSIILQLSCHCNSTSNRS